MVVETPGKLIVRLPVRGRRIVVADHGVKTAGRTNRRASRSRPSRRCTVLARSPPSGRIRHVRCDWMLLATRSNHRPHRGFGRRIVEDHERESPPRPCHEAGAAWPKPQRQQRAGAELKPLTPRGWSRLHGMHRRRIYRVTGPAQGSCPLPSSSLGPPYPLPQADVPGPRRVRHPQQVIRESRATFPHGLGLSSVLRTGTVCGPSRRQRLTGQFGLRCIGSPPMKQERLQNPPPT